MMQDDTPQAPLPSMPDLGWDHWQPNLPGFPSLKQECPEQSRPVSIVDFGLADDRHSGYVASDGAATFATPGRRLLPAVARPVLRFRWRIEGFAADTGITLEIFRHGANRPVGRYPIGQASGMLSIDGALTGVVLSGDDAALLPGSVPSAEGGPYMARLYVSMIGDDVTVVIGERRCYVDLAPIVVIGAGAAGLSAASLLLDRAPYRVRILEARDRSGGRGHTVAFSDDPTPIDLGCQWLHDATVNPWVALGAGSYPHDQIAVYRVANHDVEHFDTFDELVKSAFKQWRIDEPVSNSFDSLVHEALDSSAAVILDKRYHLARLLARRAALQEVLAAQDAVDVTQHVDLARALYRDRNRARFTTRAAGKRVFDEEGLNAELEAYISQGDWQQDPQFVANVRKRWATREGSRRQREAEAALPAHGSVQEVATLAEQLRTGPGAKLALGVECELEESIEATCFNRATANPSVLPPELRVDEVEVDVADMNFLCSEGYGRRIVQFGADLVQRSGGRCTLDLRHVVKRIVTVVGQDGVQCHQLLHLQTPSGPRVLPALATLVTVPTSLIADGTIAFTPPLPPQVQTDFANLPLGHYKKIILRLRAGTLWDRLEGMAAERIDRPAAEDEAADVARQVTLLAQQLGIVSMADQEQEQEQESSDDAADSGSRSGNQVDDLMIATLCGAIPWKLLFRRKEGIIVAFCGGSMARELDHSGLGACLTAVKAALCSALGNEVVPMFDNAFHDEVLTSQWSADPFSQGAYSYCRPGGVGARERLYGLCLHDRLVFAGEALWPGDYGTAHGAWYSGVRAVQLLLSRAQAWPD